MSYLSLPSGAVARPLISGVTNAAGLRSVAPSTTFGQGITAVVAGLGTFAFDTASLAVDNGTTVIKPNDVLVGNPGRWLAVGGGGLGGVGTPGAIAYFSAPTTLADSLLTQSGGQFNTTSTGFTFSGSQTWTLPVNTFALSIGAPAANGTLKLDTVSRSLGVDSPSTPAQKLHIANAGDLYLRIQNLTPLVNWDIGVPNAGNLTVAYGVGAFIGPTLFTFTSAGNFSLATGNVVVSDGKGIDFSATPNTGTSELFDDYEEGTWTPSFTATGGGTVGIVVGDTEAVYTKKGQEVTVSFSILIGNITGTPAGVQMNGLPYKMSAGGGTFGMTIPVDIYGGTNFANKLSMFGGTIYNGTSDIELVWYDHNNVIDLTPGPNLVANNTVLSGSFSYVATI